MEVSGFSDSMKDIDDLYDDKIGDLSRATADFEEKGSC